MVEIPCLESKHPVSFEHCRYQVVEILLTLSLTSKETPPLPATAL
jgi:hypothetical protein